MGYKSLNPPHEDTPDESDGSIQGSPLLDTGPKFPSNLADTSAASFDFQPDTPFQVRAADDSYTSQFMQESPYGDAEPNEESYGASYTEGYAQVPLHSPGKDAHLEPAPTKLLDSAPEIPAALNPHRVRSLQPGESRFVEEDMGPSPSGVPGGVPGGAPLGATSTSGGASLMRKSSSVYSSREPPHRRLGGAAAAGGGTKLSSPLEEEPFDTTPEIAQTRLNFNKKAPRPHSTFIRGTFADSSGSADKPNLAPPAQFDDEEDSLPFETTKRMAWQGRPKSMVQISQLSNGPIMSSETYKNYRKSVSSMGMLKQMSSTGSFRSQRGENKHGDDIKVFDDDDDDDDGEDNKDEDDENENDSDDELMHKQDRKRWSAKVRQDQDARMSVYRQRMTKIIGGTLEPSITMDRNDDRNSIIHSNATSVDEADSDNEEMMDDIPLSILQAHGFPKSRKKANSPMSPGLKMGGTSTHVSPNTSPNVLPPRPLSTSRMSLHSSNNFRPDGRGSPTHSPYNNVRRSPQLPSLFGNKDAMLSRGLVSEISKEEEYRKRRHTYGFDAVAAQEIAQGFSHRPASVVSSAPSQQQQPNDMQAKLDQVLAMLSKLSTDGQQSPSMWPVHSPSMSQQFPPPTPHQQPQSPFMQRAPSIRSFASQNSTPTSRYMPGSTPYNPRDSIAFSESRLPFQPLPPGMDPSMMYSMPNGMPNGMPNSMPNGLPNGLPTGVPQPYGLYQPPPRGPVSNRPSRMRMVATNDDEEEDEEAEWLKLLERRKALKDKWVQKESSAEAEPVATQQNSEPKLEEASASV